MRKVTLSFLLKENEILLAMKKRGFGKGKWNGYGGKPKPGESIVQTALREMKEEIEVVCSAQNLQHCGYLDFYFHNKPAWDQRVHIFYTKEWEGEPQETEEMKPAWFKFEEIPYKNMWVDDIHWLPKMLNHEQIEGYFKFTEDGSEIIEHHLK